MPMNTIDLVRLAERGSEAQKLWALVLLLAIRDEATRVWYDPALGEDQLGYEIGCRTYAMVPPPKQLEALLPRAVASLLRHWSAWDLMARLFSGALRRPVLVEGTCDLQVGQQEVTMTATVELTRARVLLQLSPEGVAAQDARTALECVLERYRRVWRGDTDTSHGGA